VADAVVYLEASRVTDEIGEDTCDPTASIVWWAQSDGCYVCWLGEVAVEVRPVRGGHHREKARLAHEKAGAVFEAWWSVRTEAGPDLLRERARGHIYAERGEDEAPLTDVVAEAMSIGLVHGRAVARMLEVGVGYEEHTVQPVGAGSRALWDYEEDTAPHAPAVRTGQTTLW
jgi:hypothetical protein